MASYANCCATSVVHCCAEVVYHNTQDSLGSLLMNLKHVDDGVENWTTYIGILIYCLDCRVRILIEHLEFFRAP